MKNDLLTILLQLLKIDSITGKEQAITGFIDDFCRKNPNLTSQKIGKTLCYFYHKSDALPTLALYGHTDTVNNQQDKSPYHDDKSVFGCGASDMKGGLAVMLKLIKDDFFAKSNFNLQFIFYDGEEGPYNDSGLGPALLKVPELKKADLALVLEPTLNDIQSGCLGVMNIDLTFIGKSGHSARPWQGDNPIYKALPLLSKVAAKPANTVTIDGLDFIETTSITKISAGKLKNVIPERAYANLNWRFAPHKSISAAKKGAIEFLGDEVNIEFCDCAPASKVVSQNSLLTKFKEQNSLITKPKQAWTDIARLNDAMVDAVNFGPGDPSEAHQKNEQIAINSLLDCYKILTNFIYSE
ncbi:MAG: succinyl-diaminopimelate desuccinylase [SAR324 cluster bacterium]|nr:succinyl-diaminopimelate desuccinylase [SAR324 cluster bacterium]